MLVGRFSFDMLTDQDSDRGHNVRKHIRCLILPPVDKDTKQKLLNGTWPSYFDIDLKRIQMLKVDVATIMSNQGF